MRTLVALSCIALSAGVCIAQWVQTSGPVGGTVRCFMASGTDLPAGQAGLFAGTSGGGVFLSSDDGAHWTPVNNGLTSTDVYALAEKDGNLFVGIYGDGGIFRSTDNGTSWINMGFIHSMVNAFAVNGIYLFAGTNGGGVYRSTDNGITWSAATTGMGNRRVYTMIVKDGFVFAGTYNDGGIFRSTDDGANWTAVNTGLANLYIRSFAIKDGNLFVATEGDGIYESTDNGAHWTQVWTSYLTKAVFALAVQGANIFAGTSSGVILSTDNGATWNAASTGLTYRMIVSLGVKSSNLYAGTAGGVYLSTNDGTTWAASNAGLVGTWVNAFAVTSAGLFAGTDNLGIGLSSDDGAHWSTVNTGLPINDPNYPLYDIEALAYSGTNLFAGSDRQGVYLSTDNGTSWTAARSGLPYNSKNLAYYTIYALTTSDPYVFAGVKGGGVYRTTNNGGTWTAMNTGLTNLDVDAFAWRGTTLFAGTIGGGVFLSTDNGSHWTAVNTGLTSLNVYALAVISTKLFAATWDGVFRSTNNGTNWTATSTGLAGPNVATLAVHGANLFAGNYLGVFFSSNSGASWTKTSAGLTPAFVHMLAVRGTNLFTGTEGGGVWRRPLSEMESMSTRSYDVAASWNMISVPLRVEDFRKTVLYPGAASGPYAFRGEYIPKDTLENGTGYWMRFSSAQTITITGSPVSADTIPVKAGWNMIGSISVAVSVSQISSIPPGLVLSPFFGYARGYNTTEIIEPHKAYWVMAEQDGELILDPSAGVGGSVRIVETGEQPPGLPFLTDLPTDGIPTAFRMEQNFPNPFNPSTVIQYALPSRSHVGLTVYDMLGQVVRVLVNGDIDAGNHEVRFDASGLASGVYLCRMTAPNYISTKRLILLR